MTSTVLVSFFSLIVVIQGTFLGKSKLMKCRDSGESSDPVNGDGSICDSKLIVTVTVRSGQVWSTVTSESPLPAF